MKNEQTKKPNKVTRFLKRIFVHNWDLKLIAVVLGMFLWILGVIAFVGVSV